MCTFYMPLDQFYISDFRDQISQIVNRNRSILPQAKRFAEIGTPQFVNTSQTISYITERSGLLVISPNLTLRLSIEFRDLHFPAKRSRGFLSITIPGSPRTKNIVKSKNSCFNTKASSIFQTETFRDHFSPAIHILRLSRISILLHKRHDFYLHLPILRINTNCMLGNQFEGFPSNFAKSIALFSNSSN
jgi:hypothetical protein